MRRRRLQWKTNASSLGFHFRAGALELISGTKSAEQSCNRLSGVEGGGSLLTEARAIPRPVLATLVPSQGIVPNAQKLYFQGPVLGPKNGCPNQGKKWSSAVFPAILG